MFVNLPDGLSSPVFAMYAGSVHRLFAGNLQCLSEWPGGVAYISMRIAWK
jgi:hypothetical protein